MAKARVPGSAATRDQAPGKSSKSPSSLPAAGLLSFLKENTGAQTWTERDLANALKIDLATAKDTIAVLQLQGYVELAGRTGKWRSTEQGDLVSGAKSPRFTRQSVQDAVAALGDRIKAVNDDANAAYKITEAVAFGDFLRDQARVQAADIGVRLVHKTDAPSISSAKEHAAELAFRKQLRGKTALMHVQPYEDWMKARSHRSLLWPTSFRGSPSGRSLKNP